VKILIIQTAFIGDVILATGVAESIHAHDPSVQIDFLLRKGNQGLFNHHPFIHEVLIWDKSENKIANLFKLIQRIRKAKYDHVINLHRFASSGLITALSGAVNTVGFNKNPLSLFFKRSYPHQIGRKGDVFEHETDRNYALLNDIISAEKKLPRLYPSSQDFEKITPYQQVSYICIAPSSVWFTKQWPEAKWIELINMIPENYTIHLLGAPSDKALCERIVQKSQRTNINSLCGQLSFLESAALMQKATMNYVNDSAPMHMASSMNAPVTAIYCSTIPEFGFGPLSDQSHIVEVQEDLSCRPCGLHGYKACPKGHFKCAELIDPKKILEQTLYTHIKIS
jgi:lipopolysaccharide heptosyltransferase II